MGIGSLAWTAPVDTPTASGAYGEPANTDRVRGIPAIGPGVTGAIKGSYLAGTSASAAGAALADESKIADSDGWSLSALGRLSGGYALLYTPHVIPREGVTTMCGARGLTRWDQWRH